MKVLRKPKDLVIRVGQSGNERVGWLEVELAAGTGAVDRGSMR